MTYTDAEIENICSALEAWFGLVASGYECPAAGQKMSDASAAIRQLLAQRDEAREDRATFYTSIRENEDDICQTLGKALGYPWFKDDQKNFPGATEEQGVCVGDHVAASIAAEAAKALTAAKARISELEEALKPFAKFKAPEVADDDVPDNWSICFDHKSLTWGMFRRARSTLPPQKEE